MSPPVLQDHIRARLAAAQLSATDSQVAALGAYLALLAQWNRRINLTALPVDPPTAAAIDRLIVEPLQAARHVRPADRRALDVGSGGGSPALPFSIAAPQLALTMVESRGRKAAFLREAVRQLGLPGAVVEALRVEALAARPDEGRYDVITLRAVRLDADMWRTLTTIGALGSQLLWFRSRAERHDELAPDWRMVLAEDLVGVDGNQLVVVELAPIVG